MRYLPFFIGLALIVLLAAALISPELGIKKSAHDPIIGQRFTPPQGEPLLEEAKQWKKGSPAIVSVFASWCAPCVAEHPLLLELSQDFGVPVYGIAWDKTPEIALSWLEKHGNPYRQAWLDPDGKNVLAYGMRGVPETLVVDATGTIQERIAGPLTPQIVADRILPLFGHGAP